MILMCNIICFSTMQRIMCPIHSEIISTLDNSYGVKHALRPKLGKEEWFMQNE
jgi:hypothetical protein